MVWLLTAQQLQRFVQVDHLNKFTPRIGIGIKTGFQKENEATNLSFWVLRPKQGHLLHDPNVD